MTETTADFVEKRREKRITIKSDVKVKDIAENYTIITECCNYSKSGILVKASENLRVGTKVTIEILNEQHPLEAEGSIVRIVRDEKIYLTAIIFD